MGIFIFDIDGTICRTKDGKYRQSVPIKKRIEDVNYLYDTGHTIIFHTARGTVTKRDWEELTKRQFKKWGVKYHELVFGKPFGHYYIDNRGTNAQHFFNRNTR